jgi:hypothetical protein
VSSPNLHEAVFETTCADLSALAVDVSRQSLSGSASSQRRRSTLLQVSDRFLEGAAAQ